MIAALWLITLTMAQARPEAPRVLCEQYPAAETCAGRVAECTTCHTSTEPASWNPFGLQLLDNFIFDESSYAESLSRALQAIAAFDADDDGVSNADEIWAGTSPGDGSDAWPYCVSEIQDPDASGAPLAADYDLTLAFQRAHALLCGVSPSFEQMSAFESTARDRAAGYQALHDTVDSCLDSAYWRDVALHTIASPLIKPLLTLGVDSPVGFTVADYEWDYRLFAYIMTGDRDVRDLLLADYHVALGDNGALTRVEGIQPPGAPLPPEGHGGQPLEPEHRAGMLTTQWFLMLNADSPLPRMAAAQAYRVYLGMDIALQEGIWPVANEPADVDRAGIAAPNCAVCHSTLDPLSYAFAVFDGFPGSSGNPIAGTYNPGKPVMFLPDWNDNKGAILGQPVDNLRQWAERAVASDAFQRTVGLMAFRHLLQREPTIAERPHFNAVWQSLPGDDWSFSRLIHRVIDIPAFGGAR